MNTKLKISIISGAVLLVLFIAFHGPLLTKAGSFLIYQDAIEPADAVLVLGGGKKERAEQGIALYKAGYARAMMFTGQTSPWGGTNWAEVASKYAQKNGVPEKNIILITRPKSTRDDALLSKEECLKHNFKSLIVTSEPYHTKRAYHVFRRAYDGSGIKVMLYPVQDSWYRKDGWWKSKSGVLHTCQEYAKMVYYSLRGYLK